MILTSGWIPNPPTLEEVDPELAELLRLFVNGELQLFEQVGRNDPCPCGALKNGKPIKFKKCHGKEN